MADRNFVKPRNGLGKVAQVLKVEVVARIDPESAAERLFGCEIVLFYGLLPVFGVVPGITLGV